VAGGEGVVAKGGGDREGFLTTGFRDCVLVWEDLGMMKVLGLMKIVRKVHEFI